MSGFEQIFFWFFGVLAVFSALMVILLRNPLSCAFFLILSFVNLAGIYALLHAHLVAVSQILVYAGGIMVLFIFVIMLLNIGRPQFLKFMDLHRSQAPGLVVSLVTLAGFLLVIFKSHGEFSAPKELVPDFGTIHSVGKLMFTQYLVPFELIGVLLLVATVGAVLLAKRDI